MKTRSFLAGLSVGRSLRGWAGSGAGLSLAPFCWTDPGVTTYFYIDYRYGLQNVSYGRFRNKTALFGTGGEIVPTEVEAVDSHTVKVWADIAGEVCVRIYGNAKPGLAYFDGTTVGAFAAELYPAGDAPYALPYMAESANMAAVTFGTEERFMKTAEETEAHAAKDAAVYVAPALAPGEQLAVTYTS
ncbi:MAG: hypothetical protein IJZ66_01825 [Oscillibacter sp.]|nr:hypothetical protein [Oscillibacter sp.]